MSRKSTKSARGAFRRVLRFAKALFVVALAASAYLGYRVWPRALAVSLRPRFPVPAIQDDHLGFPFSLEIASAEVASFDDQLEAYLHFEYLRGRDPEDAWRVLLTATKSHGTTSYRIFMVVENDLLTAVPHLSGLEGFGLIKHYELVSWTQKDLARFQQQSLTFESAYNMPTQKKLETLPSFQLVPELARFLVFKSQTDWRVINSSANAPTPLTPAQATRLASDIVAVTRFYSLPLDYFLGVGAMENNYMEADGDLNHSIWKKRAQPGDIVLQRRSKRVLVSDYSIGAWQISRETLRRAHVLYLQDKRDYGLLPPRLRPPRQLDLNSLDPELFTTYAGLLLRDLLDRFGGNVDEAIGAYNGGVRNPNPAYASGVKTVALYARKVLEHASVLDPQLPAMDAITPDLSLRKPLPPAPEPPILTPSPAAPPEAVLPAATPPRPPALTPTPPSILNKREKLRELDGLKGEPHDRLYPAVFPICLSWPGVSLILGFPSRLYAPASSAALVVSRFIPCITAKSFFLLTFPFVGAGFLCVLFYPLYFLSVPHSFSQRRSPNHFAINRFRTLSHAMGPFSSHCGLPRGVTGLHRTLRGTHSRFISALAPSPDTPYCARTSRRVTMPSNLRMSARLTTGKTSNRLAPSRSCARSKG